MIGGVTKEIKGDLQKIQADYLENLERIKPDLKNYYEAAFNKFIYQFHKTMSHILHLDDNLTVDEIAKYMKNLASAIYQVGREIKEKEDQLLKEKDKKAFADIQAEIKRLTEKKLYFGTLERNIAEHNLIFEIEDIIEKINWLGFSGEKVNKEVATQTILRSENYIRNLTAARVDEHSPLEFFGSLLKKKHENLSLSLAPNEVEFIKSQVGEEAFNKYSLPIIQFMRGVDGKCTIEETEQLLREKGWNNEAIIPTIQAVRMVMEKRD